MAARSVASRLPLWKRRAPRYPVYWPGNPQTRVLLPQFWMKLVKPKKEVPPDRVHFIVHPEMSKFDIKQYLEKIYKVPVLNVKVSVRPGEDLKHPRGYEIWREDDFKMAFVQLGEDCTFEFPDIFTVELQNLRNRWRTTRSLL
ncbi:hypothetical protein ScPMuIL_012628 [Solemya velum]